MIGIYDIGRNEESQPYLIKVGKYDVKKEITSTNEGLIKFVRDYIRPQQYDNEHMYLLALDRRDKALGVLVLGIGTYKSCEYSKRTVAEFLILSGAKRFMMIHNHPDKTLKLSRKDHSVAKQLDFLADLFEIESLGNFVITNDGFVGSYMDEPIYFEDMED